MFARCCGVLLLLCWVTVQAQDYTNFRVGGGIWQFSVDPGHPDHSDYGYALMAEFPQSEHAGSRFLVVGLNGEQGFLLRGVESQLYWGWGLASPGWRLYSGPTWHWQKARHASSRHQVHNGWGWHLGTGFQWRALTIDIAAGYRLADDYRRDGKTPTVMTSSVIASYRF
ncbi:hypothetical protein GCM10011297_05030 [Bacterioplanes sanyensis]|uniref:hypothetical protein n=1 Tax=Bacterioplanes sanyensis TaxID=1249553 RepID=UPI001673CD48|nr:hypothetical protein [Bacterioplanes sanyensis]GGY34951.1 hypothetical protein GCM10011297_05030 [Bacterioplanes sanyensis]